MQGAIPESRRSVNPMERLLSVKEAADKFSCSEAAIRKWIYQRRLPVVKIGRLTRLRQTDLEAVVANGLRHP
jgi:excisionase family DNA binding protein